MIIDNAQLPEGYKLTDMGGIPEDWNTQNLSGISHKITDGDHITPKRTSQGYYLLSARNILNGRIDVSDVDYVGMEEYQRMKQRCCPEAGDILISCSGTIGRISVVPVDFECVLVRSAALVKINRLLADSSFIQYWLQASKAQAQISISINQGAQPNLFLNHIERLKCVLPPLPEQRSIATTLSDMDELLGALDRLIAKKRDLKQVTMQQLLTGKTRLPGFNGEWELKQLGDLSPLQRGFDLPNSQLKQGSFPVVYSNGILNHHAVFQAQGPGVVTGRSGTIGKVTFVEDNYWPHNTSLWVTSFKGNDPKFIFYLYTRLNFERFATGSGVPTLNRNDVHSFETRIPPTVEEQTTIATILSDMDTEISALEQRRDKTRALKQAMMQELLTGRIRLV